MNPDFIKSLETSLGGDVCERFLEAQDSPVTVSVRRNPSKLESLSKIFPEVEPVPWCTDGAYLEHRPVFALDPLFHAGAYYVQDAASMAVGALFERFAKPGIRVLDLCAAPGGKTTHLLSAMSSDSLLVANEVISQRATVLAENVTKWGKSNVVVTSCDPSEFARLGGYFDIIVADVPCSGEGMFRKDDGAVEQWSPDNVALCAARQKRIISDVWNSLKEGGILIYSTCTFNTYENDSNVSWVCSELGAEVVECEDFPETKGNVPLRTLCGFQFVPGITRGEGQYCAVLRKTKGVGAPFRRPKSSKVKIVSCGWISQNYQAVETVTSSKEILLKAYPKELMADMTALEDSLKCLRSGVAVASMKGKDLIPQAALALSVGVMATGAFREAGISKEQALAYLRLQPIVLPDFPKGFVLVTYGGIPLGFVKNLGNRTNNLFPTAWRLRMG